MMEFSKLDNIYKLPRGVKVYFAEEALLKRDTENAILDTFEQWGYDYIVPPTLGFYNNLVKTFDAAFQNRVYKFVDRDGEVLALRPDFTVQIVRLIATSLKDYLPPIRVCYAGNVFLQSMRDEAKLREYYQAGVEYFDRPDKFSINELIFLAFETLRKLTTNDFKINIGDLRIINKIISENHLEKKRHELLQAIKLRNYDEIMHITNSSKIAEIVNCVGDSSMLKRALTLFPEAQKEIQELIVMTDELSAVIPSKILNFDLAQLHDLPYYTSIVFETYIQGIGTQVLSGGQYDALCQAYGINLAGAGFAINIDKLLPVLSNSLSMPSKILVIGKRDLSLEIQLRQKKKIVEYFNSTAPSDEMFSFAKRRNFDKILWIKPNNALVLVDVKTQKEQPVSIEDI